MPTPGLPHDESDGRDSAVPRAGAPAGGHDAAPLGPAGSPITSTLDAPPLHQLLVESVRDHAIFALDRSGQILTWNPGGVSIYGYESHETVGHHVSMLYQPVERDAGVPEHELEAAAVEGRLESDNWRVRKDGTHFWASTVISAMRSDSGEVTGFAIVTRDLTDRRRAEEMLRRSEERFRLLVQSVRDYAIFMLDPEGRVVNWNDGAQRIKGYRADEIVGRHFSIFYPAEARDAAWPEHELKVAAIEGRFEDEGWRLRKDGSRFWANVVITALFSPSGQLLGFAKVTRDLTERREAERAAIEAARRLAHEEAERAAAERRTRELTELSERLRTQSEELEQRTQEAESANRAKADFLAAMSHELRTPLNAIGGYAELLEMELRGPLTDAQRQDVERIRRSQQHLLGIINDILSFSRLEAGQVAYDMGPVVLQDVMDTVAAMIAPQAAAKAIHFERATCPAEAVAQADRQKVEQVLVNLLGNAVKFTEPGGTVALGCAVDGDRVLVSVRDTGSGIAPEQHESIFEPFVQVGRNLTSRSEGTGLGLAISRDLARGMGGDITLESVEGEGSTFTLVLRRA